VSSRLFFGEGLCRNEEWINLTTTYTRNVASAFNAINSLPALLRPFLCRFLLPVRVLQQQVHRARKLLDQVLDKRTALKTKGEAPDYVDAIEWFEQVAKGRNYNPIKLYPTASGRSLCGHWTTGMEENLSV
jgi:cytochrome P450 monooxygenase-1